MLKSRFKTFGGGRPQAWEILRFGFREFRIQSKVPPTMVAWTRLFGVSALIGVLSSG